MRDKQPNTASSNTRPLLEVIHLSKSFPLEKGILRKQTGTLQAVDDVTFHINEGETFGLVGESGCGKTTLGRCIVRAITSTSGSIFINLPGGDSLDITAMTNKELRGVRKHFHMIFQDPYGSLDPRMTILDIVAEPIRNNSLAKGQEVTERVKSLMVDVGLEIKHLNRYPHAFSGGQRQRIGIARSLAPQPSLIVCDEPVSALDVSIQAQILNLLKSLQEQYSLTYLFIAHDLAVVEHVADRVAVMYVGQLVEMAYTDSLYSKPLHPYTEALLSAVPSTDPMTKMDRIILPGEVADPSSPPTGCYFHPRCPYAQNLCETEIPQWEETTPGHFVACHYSKELELKGVEV